MRKWILFFLCCMAADRIAAQTDTTQKEGTIKIAKKQAEKTYILASATFKNPGPNGFIPFPVVEGHAFPFSYTKFFNDRFKNTAVDLKGKETDTVIIEIKVLANGKVYLKDRSPSMMINGIAVFYDPRSKSYEVNNQHLHCIDFLKKIKEWYPAYTLDTRKGKFKGQTVIRPYKTNIDSSGIITVVFSTTPFD